MNITYATNAHLREEDGHLFAHDDRDFSRKLKRASEDVRLDLQGHGYFKSTYEEVIDHSSKAMAAATVTVSATTTIPAGTIFSRSDDSAEHGGLRFKLLAEETILENNSAALILEAVEFGDVYNTSGIDQVDAELPGIESIAQDGAALGGKDHQLTRATTYRAMELICADLMRERDDAWDHKRSVYCKMYKDEIKRRVAAGIEVDRNGDGVATGETERRNHGFHRFQRG